MNLGQAIKDLRKDKGIKQGAFANQCGITPAYLSQIENNRREPNLSTLKLISEKLDTPLPVIFFKSMNDEDIPDDKKEIYKFIYPSLNELVHSVFFQK